MNSNPHRQRHMMLAGAHKLAVACDSYQWSDDGASVQLTVPLPTGIPAAVAQGAVQCCFQRSAVCLTMTGGAAAQHVLRLRPLYAPVSPEHCSWQHDNGGKSMRATADSDAAIAGPVVVADTKAWAVRITLCKEEPSIAWSSLIHDTATPPCVPVAATILSSCSQVPVMFLNMMPLCRGLAEIAPQLSLAAMRRAIREQRAAKQPGDGLLYKMPCISGDIRDASSCSHRYVADPAGMDSAEVSRLCWLCDTCS